MNRPIPKSELLIIKSFILNTINYIENESIDASHDFIEWILQNQSQLELPIHCQFNEDAADNSTDDENDYEFKRKAKTIQNKKNFMIYFHVWSRKFERHVKSSKSIRISPIQKTCNWIGKLCDIDKMEIDVLVFLALCEKYTILKSLGHASRDNMRHLSLSKPGIDEDCLTSLVGIDSETIYELEKLKVIKYGIVEYRRGRIHLSRTIKKIILNGIEEEDELKRLVIGEGQMSNLSLSDFSYLGDNVETLAKIIKGHDEARGKSLNIFIYGAPGTGKTEFTKSIGNEVGRKVYFVGEQDENAQDVTRSERVSSLMLLGGLKDNSNSKILVIDEADEILNDIGSNKDTRDRGSKIFLNRLLEKIKTPVVWIVNDHRSIDDAVLRRMNYSIEFPKPPLKVRKSIITKIANDNKAQISEDSINELARYDTSPAYFENAIRIGQNINGDLNIIQQILENNISTTGQVIKEIKGKNDFKLELCNANLDLIKILDSVKICKTSRLTFCFSGLPGTGKSEYARFLAKELGYEILYKRYSDLASKWLGECEQNIAKAFQEASQKKAFLIIDEADSLLMRRENAQKSWEVTQVNEFLTQIENHEYPFAITTNAFDNLDTAAMRRFLFKVKFFAMSRDQVEIAFQHFFGDTAPKNLLHCDGLTPADFALIRNQANILGIKDKYRIAEMLLEEVSTRGNTKARIGF